jgi:translation elongation factor P/translation initiation factor 5A
MITITENGVTNVLPDDNKVLSKVVVDIDVATNNSGIEYTNILYNDDDTITFTDKDGIEHTMECEYIDDNPTSINYAGKDINLLYDGDLLVKIGETVVDFENVESSGGGGVEYTDIIYNEDNSITLTDRDGTEHTMVGTYEGEKLASATYDGKEIAIGYEDNKLIVGNTVVDLSDAKISVPAKNVEAVGIFATDIIVPTVTITNELKDNGIKVVGLSATNKE